VEFGFTYNTAATAPSAADVESFARAGTTRLVVGPAATGCSGQRAELSAFADRLALRAGG
jgi:hypothetical protein